ncbi:hypothetical protein QZH41_007116 [Actinostola sp. cb2023]|nr:hypothetical protein QZH41_007116 [Actinostola sp. cb2023]
MLQGMLRDGTKDGCEGEYSPPYPSWVLIVSILFFQENNVDSESVVNSSASDQFFGASVLSQPDHTAADNVSLSSVDIIRKDSISSSVSSSSETASFDTRSLDLKSVTATSTPPAAVRARPVPPSSSGQTREIKLTPPALEDENHDYETIPSSRDYETIPSDLIAKATANKTETKTGYAGFSFKETFAGDDQSFPVDFAKSNSAEKKSDVMVDPFRSPDQPEAKSSISEGSPPSSAVFGNDDFFSSHFDDKAESAHAPSTDFPVDDPFAPTSNAPPKEFQSGDAFASSDAFESAFGPGRMSPVPFELEQNHDEFEGDINSNKTGEKESEKSEAFASSSAFDAAFSSSEMPPPLFKATEEDSDKECTNEKPSTEEPKPELSWSNAFGESEPKENEKDTHKAELSWSTAFGESETHDDKEDNKPTKSDESKATFTWDDSFETKFDTEEVDKAQQPDKVATEPDFSWTNAFDDKPKKEVTFSWDDAFGGQTDTKDGLTENAFGEIKFSDAFASTPFKVPQTKNESTVEGADAFHTNHFESFLTPIKADIPVNDTEDKHSVSNEGKDSPEDITNKEEGGSEVSQSSEPGSVESERKAKLADDEDLSSSDKESDTNDSEMISEDVETLSKTIPQIIEPNNEDSSDNADDKPVRPVTLSILPTKPTNEQESPSVPPPLPPRPMAPLPSLPPRPRTYSSPVMGQIPPTPPQPAGCITSPTLKPGTPKRLPPALPPRIDLEAGKACASSVFAGSTLNSDPFSSPQTTISPDKENSWQAKWSGETPNEKEKDSSNSKHSPDPFGDDFFTDFNFSAAKTADHKTNSTAQDNHQLFSEPFASKEGEEDMFKAHFGGVDPFAEFSSNNTNIDPFASDGAVVFPGFSTSKDPFDDSMDPFAEKSTRSDPFAVSPKTNANDGTSFHLSKVGIEGVCAT